MIRLSALLLSAALLQSPGGAPPQAAGEREKFSVSERAQLEREKKIDGRVKVYDRASQRYLKAVKARIKDEDLGGLKAELEGWRGVLEEALGDVEASVQPGKKQKPLRQFEIRLRKAIAELEGLKTTSGVEAFDLLHSWSARAEEIRSRFVDILFQR